MFPSPLGVAVDGAGNVYIADAWNNRIRKVSAGTGIITTVAGRSSSSGFSGDGGLATAAVLGGPVNVAVDAAGNFYISEANNNRVRKVTAATGIITTVAGNGSTTFSGDNGVATAAGLSYPDGMAVNAAGELYLADSSHQRVRKVSAAGGITTVVGGNWLYTFAGDNGPATSAALNSPSGVTVDSIGNLLIADQSNHRIRKVYFNPVPTTTALASSTAGPVTTGVSVTFSASVTSSDGTPSGTVTFLDGSDTLGSSPLDGSGTASFETSALSAGDHRISAVYSAAGIHAASGSAALMQTVQAPVSHALTIPFSGSGSGHVMVAPAPPGIPCPGSCSQQFAVGTAVTLTASAEPGSFLTGWSGCDAVAGNVCTLMLISDRTAAANFEFDWPIYLGLSRVGYGGTLQQAYDAQAPGLGLFWLRAGSSDGGLVCDREVQLTLQGGWDAGSNALTGRTDIRGALKIKAGRVSFGGIAFR